MEETHFGSTVSINSIGSGGQTEFIDDQSSLAYLTGRKSVHNLESLTLLELMQWSSLGSCEKVQSSCLKERKKDTPSLSRFPPSTHLPQTALECHLFFFQAHRMC